MVPASGPRPARGNASCLASRLTDMRKVVLLAILMALSLPTYAQHHPVYGGKVVCVLDGKTLHIEVRPPSVPSNEERTIVANARLWGIDLSTDRKHAEAAKRLVTKLALGRNVHVDDYSNEAWVRIEGAHTSLNAALVSAGLARRWKPSGIHDFEHHEKELERAENEAKGKKLGIWKAKS